MRWVRILGIAGLVGVIATGAVLARSRRSWHDYDNAAIRQHLHGRLAAADAAPPA